MNIEDMDEIAKLDLYQILDVEQDDERKVIKKSYRQLAKLLHPDKKGGDADAFELVNLAYTVLSKSETRKSYDEKRRAYLQSRQFTAMKDQFQADLDEIRKNLKDEGEAKEDFVKLNQSLDEKHGFDASQMEAINQDEMKRRMDELMAGRNDFETLMKETVKERKGLSKEDFNDIFIEENRAGLSDMQTNLIGNNSTSQLGSDIIAFNQDDNMGLSNPYTSFDNFELYSEGASTADYSSINDAFNQQMPENIVNSFADHNVITDDQRALMEQRIKEQEEEYEKMKNRSLKEIMRPITGGNDGGEKIVMGAVKVDKKKKDGIKIDTD